MQGEVQAALVGCPAGAGQGPHPWGRGGGFAWGCSVEAAFLLQIYVGFPFLHVFREREFGGAVAVGWEGMHSWGAGGPCRPAWASLGRGWGHGRTRATCWVGPAVTASLQPAHPPPQLAPLPVAPADTARSFLPAFEVRAQVCVVCAGLPATPSPEPCTWPHSALLSPHLLPPQAAAALPMGCGPGARRPGTRQNKPALFPCQDQAGRDHGREGSGAPALSKPAAGRRTPGQGPRWT